MDVSNTLSAIAGGLLVAIANHHFQIRREFVKFKQQKAEEIVMRIVSLKSHCERIQTKSVVRDDKGEFDWFRSTATLEEEYVEVDRLAREAYLLVLIYYKDLLGAAEEVFRSLETCVDELRKRNRFLAQ